MDAPELDLERRAELAAAHPDRRQALGRRESDRVPKFNCPRCKNLGSVVIESRPVYAVEASIRRRRECDRCGKRYTTREVLESVE